MAAATTDVKFGQFSKTAGALYRTLDSIDQAAEKGASLPRTADTFSQADFDSAEKILPGVAMLLRASIGNATAQANAEALQPVCKPPPVSDAKPAPAPAPATTGQPPQTKPTANGSAAQGQSLPIPGPNGTPPQQNRPLPTNGIATTQAIQNAHASGSASNSDRMLRNYIGTAGTNLSVAEAIAVAQAARAPGNRDIILIMYAQANAARLGPAELNALSSQANTSYSRDIILQSVNRR